MKILSHYLEYAQRPQFFEEFPLNWGHIFQRDADLAVEIGFGNGEYLTEWAASKPDWNFVGIELSIDSMERVQRRIQKKNISNVCPIREDARFALREFFADNTVNHIVMNFPDPWPKDRHQDRRLIDVQFIETLAAVLKTNCYYELVSDQQWYVENARAYFGDSPYFETEAIEKNPRRNIITKYEKKWQELGRYSYRLLARKKISSSPKRLLKDSTMPHAFIEAGITEDTIKNLIGFQHTENDLFFIVKDTFLHLDKEEFLLHVITKDTSFKQNFHIQLYRHKSGRWLAKLDINVQPYRTPAVKMAVYKIANHLNGE